MSASDPSRGHVLLLTNDHDASERLSRWIATTGHEVVAPSGTETLLMNEGDDERVGLVVTDLDSDDPAARALLDRLIGGELFPSVPQLHVFRDPMLMHAVQRAHPSLVGFLVAAPVEVEDLQARVRLAAEIGSLRRELALHSIRDGLTGLVNRRYLLLRLEEEFSRARRHRTPVSLVLIDIDDLKVINDTHGQAAGDATIRCAGRIIRSQVRLEDVIGRIGEDLFGVVLAGNRYRGAAAMANKIRTQAETTVIPLDGVELAIRLSAGISTFPDNRAIRSAEDLVRMAEDALSKAKARGGNRVFIDEGAVGNERRVILVADPDADLLEQTEDLLTLDDLRVIKAGSARTALETLRLHRPDLLVLDLGMLEEEGGPSLVQRIQQMGPGNRFPIIGLSKDGAIDPDRLYRLGIDRFITKPFSLSFLRSAARELLETHRP